MQGVPFIAMDPLADGGMACLTTCHSLLLLNRDPVTLTYSESHRLAGSGAVVRSIASDLEATGGTPRL